MSNLKGVAILNVMSEVICFQAELGDYDPTAHTPAYISEFRFVPNQTEEMELAFLEKFKACK